jgi:hexosaminidase
MHSLRFSRYFLAIGCLVLYVPMLHAGKTATAPGVIPKPARMEIRSGAFAIGPKTRIDLETSSRGADWVGEYLSGLLSKALGHTIPVQITNRSGPHHNAIIFSLQGPATLGPEGYEMAVSRDLIHISAPKVAGLFYAVQTLRQMLPPQIEGGARIHGSLKVSCARIQDLPRFAWRGLMLDCSRTFLGMDYLRRTVDLMALYKLNVLHLHLTDDQGWRLQINEYPELTTVGAHFAKRFGGGGGFYTQQQMRGLVTYARKRNITIVPEIEMPGHSEEVLAAYPGLACPVPGKKAAFEVAPFWDFILQQHFSEPLCVCNGKVFEMYRNILSEVIALFPSRFIHVGGDEVPKDAWKASPFCRSFMKTNGLKNAEGLQSYFMKRIEKVIAAKGRRMIGWDEILEGGLAPGATVMSWRGTRGGLAAARAGHDVVMAPNTYNYFDYTYDTTPTQKVYSYNPAEGFSAAMARHILGVEACMWTHIAVTERAIDYQIYPRLLALSEVGWSPQQSRDWSGFDHRLRSELPRLQALGVTYRDPQAVGIKVGEWSGQDLAGETPRVFNWDVTTSISGAAEVEVQVRWGSGTHAVYARRVALLEDGRQTSHAVFPAPLDRGNDVEIAWLSPGARHPGSRYTLRVTLQGTKDGSSAGSVWIMKPPGPAAEAVHPRPSDE